MLAPLDLAVLALWLVGNVVAGLWFVRRNRSTDDYFVGGRSLPWWAVGTSMVATTFAADTPLVVSGYVAKGGIAANWVWWTFGLSGAVSVFLFARLWRRAGVVTDVELIELRYDGTEAKVLRGLRAVWSGVFMNVLVIAWVTSAMAKIVTTTLGFAPDDLLLGLPAQVTVVLGLFLLTMLYTVSAGLWGVVVTDVVQFAVAMAGALLLGGLAWAAVGGLPGLIAGFDAHGFDWTATTALVPLHDPAPDGATAKFAALVLVVWWSQSNIDGGGYIAQRLLAAKDERHALWAYLWFTIAHVCLRPWPWLVVGLAGMAMIGPTEDPERYYPQMMAQLVPAGLFGVMLASFFAAYMSTISTQLNWGASLLLNDLYRRFLRPGAADAHYMLAGRGIVVLLSLVGAFVSFAVTEVSAAWELAFSVTAGIGTVYIARWYWWRVNAWSEITAMIVAIVCTYGFSTLAASPPPWLDGVPAGWLGFPFRAAITALISIPIWVGVTLLTRPVRQEHLLAFYQRVRPGGPGWTAVAGERARAEGPGLATLAGIVGFAAAVYGVLLGVGSALLGSWTSAGAYGLMAVVGTVVAGRAVVRETATRPAEAPAVR